MTARRFSIAAVLVALGYLVGSCSPSPAPGAQTTTTVQATTTTESTTTTTTTTTTTAPPLPALRSVRTVEVSGTGNAIARCAAGEVLISGGYSGTWDWGGANGTGEARNRPRLDLSPPGWEAQLGRSLTRPITAYAVCGTFG